MRAQLQITQHQTQDELDLQYQISHLTTFCMELGRRHGLGSKALEFKHLPLQQRKDRLEALLDFIHDANDERSRRGENPNMHRDISGEFDRRYPDPPTLSAATG